MAFKKPTSFLTDPADEQADYLAATSPVGPRYVAPDPNEAAPDPDLYSPITPSAPNSQRVAPSDIDPDLDPNAYSPATPKSAQMRQELEDLATKRPSKEPGFWRTLAGIGAGIGVGYLTRNPNMIASVTGRVMHPGQADWNNAWNDKLAQVQQQEKIEADAQAAAKGTADVAHVQAETRNQNNQADWYNKPDAPKAPTPVTKEIIGADGKKHTRYYPNPNEPDKFSDLGVAEDPGAVKGDPDTQLGIAAWKRIPGNEGKEPTLDDLATIKGTFRPDAKDPAITEPLLRIRSTGSKTGVPTVDAMSAQQAKQALQAGKEPKEASEASKKDRAINAAFRTSGNNWSQVAADVRAGKYVDYAGDILDHAEKMTKLSPAAQTKVTAADTTAQQVQAAIDAIDEVTKTHPDLIGDVGHHPLNAAKRRWETYAGSEPAEIGAVDSTLETAAALQPGQHNFRSLGALAEFKKSLGIDPRTGKADGSRAWLINPEKAKSALKAVAEFNQRLKENTLNAAGRSVPSTAPSGVPPPTGGVPTISNRADYDKLPSGAQYIDAGDGQQKQKR